MSTIKAHSVFSSDKLFPVYAQYPQQFNPQPAFISLDTRDGEIDADYSGEIGNAVPVNVWDGTVLRFPIPAMTTTSEIEEAITEHLADFQAILDCEDSEKAQSLKYDLEHKLEVIGGEASVCTLAEFLQDGLFPAPEQTVADFVTELAGLNGENGYYFSTSVEPDTDDVQNELMKLWADHLYAGEHLPRAAALALLADGRCDDSAWMDELREFAQAE